MKNIFLIALAAVLVTSCKKEGAVGACIGQTDDLSAVSASDNATIQTLLNTNSLSGKNQVFTGYASYTGTNQQSQSVFYQEANSVQVRNGLPIFYSTLNYSFQNGVFNGSSGTPYGAITLDTKPSQTLPVLRQLFTTEAINKQGFNASYKDSCYVAQFGYYNINLNNSADTTASFVKAWEIHPKNSLYPQCYVRDDNGTTIYFDSGLRTFYGTTDGRKK